MENPLERLLVSATELDRDMLATTLAGLVQIDKDTGEIRLTREAIPLPKRLQILVYLMARKAAKGLNLISEEGIASSELTSKLGMRGGPARGLLSLLVKERLVDNVNGKYSVPNYAVESVKALLEQQIRRDK